MTVSGVGSGGPPAALAAAQRSLQSTENQTAIEQSRNAAAAARERQANREVGEAGEEVADRDADGRTPWHQRRLPDQDSPDAPAQTLPDASRHLDELA